MHRKSEAWLTSTWIISKLRLAVGTDSQCPEHSTCQTYCPERTCLDEDTDTIGCSYQCSSYTDGVAQLETEINGAQLNCSARSCDVTCEVSGKCTQGQWHPRVNGNNVEAKLLTEIPRSQDKRSQPGHYYQRKAGTTATAWLLQAEVVTQLVWVTLP